MTRKGTYVLVLSLNNPAMIEIGRLGKHRFEAGYYAYVGSALNSLDTRLARHFGFTKKKIHWHIDYLLEKGKVESAFVYETVVRNECLIAEAMGKRYTFPVKGFGSSDCGCASHLFYSGEELPWGFCEKKLKIGNVIFKRY